MLVAGSLLDCLDDFLDVKGLVSSLETRRGEEVRGEGAKLEVILVMGSLLF
jgi:hypothetical protein